jgi:hypothetical protein
MVKEKQPSKKEQVGVTMFAPKSNSAQVGKSFFHFMNEIIAQEDYDKKQAEKEKSNETQKP